ncbi:MAG: hypothetical protein ACX94B_13005 [Henriciella sp.]
MSTTPLKLSDITNRPKPNKNDVELDEAMQVIAKMAPGKTLKAFLERVSRGLPPRVDDHGALAFNAGERSLASYLLFAMEASDERSKPGSKPKPE